MTALRQDDILSAVWRACDTFRGAVDATQYKDYVLTALFLKYISDVRRKHVEEFRREYGGDELRIQRRLGSRALQAADCGAEEPENQ